MADEAGPSRRTVLAGASAALAAGALPSPASAAEQAAGFPGIDAWLNSAPLSPGTLRGRVYVVSFWARQCFNCRHALPYIKNWYARHAARGFTVIGVHTPEFEVEKSLPALREAVSRLGIRYPVAMDARSATWTALGKPILAHRISRRPPGPHRPHADRRGRLRRDGPPDRHASGVTVFPSPTSWEKVAPASAGVG